MSDDTDTKINIGGILNCLIKAELFAVVRRSDTMAAVEGVTVKAETLFRSRTATSAASTGIADFGEVTARLNHTLSTQLTGALATKFVPGPSRDVAVPASMRYGRRLLIDPKIDLKLILLGPDDKPVANAEWVVSGFRDQTGKTGADGVILLENIGAATRQAVLEVTLPPPSPKVPAPVAPAAPVAGATPPYPPVIREKEFWDVPVVAPKPAPPEAKALQPALKHRFTLDIKDVEDMTAPAADEWRLQNLGFRWAGAPGLTEAIKAYQRWYQAKKFAGSGAMADIKAELKAKHDDA